MYHKPIVREQFCFLSLMVHSPFLAFKKTLNKPTYAYLLYFVPPSFLSWLSVSVLSASLPSEDLDDLRMEGVMGLVPSGSKFSQGRSSYHPEPQAKVTLNICSRCAR